MQKHGNGRQLILADEQPLMAEEQPEMLMMEANADACKQPKLRQQPATARSVVGLSNRCMTAAHRAFAIPEDPFAHQVVSFDPLPAQLAALQQKASLAHPAHLQGMVDG